MIIKIKRKKDKELFASMLNKKTQIKRFYNNKNSEKVVE